MYRKVKITKGSSGWGGPLVLEPNETCNKVLCVTGGGIHPVAAKIAEMTGAETVDGFKTTVPDEQVLVAVVDCGGTARCGVYPKKQKQYRGYIQALEALELRFQNAAGAQEMDTAEHLSCAVMD